MNAGYNLNRFIQAQESTYEHAFEEVKSGRKVSHWMWFIFPQIQGLGHSEMAKRFAIRDIKEAELYLQDPVLGPRLVAISKLLPGIKGKTVYDIFGSPDDLKLRSSMTLFSCVRNSDPVFQEVIDLYFEGKKDDRTLGVIR